MANPNDATFHAKITADARDFIQQTEAASAALASLVAQASKQTSSSQAANTKSGESEVKKLGASMRAEQEKTSRAVQEDIKQENRLRAEGVRAAGASSGLRNFVTAPKPLTTMPGPVRDGAQGFNDEQKLLRQFQNLTGAVHGYTRGLTEAEKVSRRLADIRLTSAKNLTRLEGPTRNQADESKLINGMKALNAERKKELDHFKANIANERFNKSIQAQAAAENRKQMDAMVTGRYALYDLSQAYNEVGMAGLRFLGFFKQAIMTAAEFETAFTSVEGAIRPLPEEVDALRESLIELTREIPLSFTQISEIATLGAQMGVASKDIEGFTKTVAGFSAITGASIDETAEAFGRISSLADVPVDEFDNLASSILFAGVNAVATEEQILTITQSIAAASRQAGFSADEIVGLGTALSSLGVQPEQARGVIVRLFGDFGREIDLAGEKLQVYSKISGMSAEDIKASWGSDPKVFFGAFLEGLSEVENKTQALDAAGIVDTREVNVIQRLVGSLDVYNSAMDDSIGAYADGTYLGERYAMTVDNLASKFIILQNNLAAFGDAIGGAVEGPLKTLVDALSFVLVSITKFAQTPLGGFVVGFTAVTAALVTGFTLIAALGFKATAQVFAMRTAMIQMQRAGQNASGGIMELIRTMTGSVRMVEVDTMVKGKNIVSTQFMTRAQAQSAGVLKQWTAAAGTATVAGKGLTTTIRALGIASGVLTAVTLVGIATEMIGAADAAKKLQGVEFNDIADAVRRDTEAMKEGKGAYSTFTIEVEKSKDELGKTADAHERIAAASDIATEALDDNTVAFGENTEAALRNAFATNEALQKTLKQYSEAGQDITKILEDAGGSWEELVQASLADPGSGAANYIKELMPDIADEIFVAQTDILGGMVDFNNEFVSLLPFAGGFAMSAKAKKELADIVTSLDETSKELKDGANYSALFGGAIVNAANEGSDGLDELESDVRTTADIIAGSFDAINNEMNLQEAITGMGKSLQENGKEFDTYSEGGRENIRALQDVINAYAINAGDDADLLATNLSTLMSALGVMGINSAFALDMVTTALKKSGGVSQEVVDEALNLLVGGLTNVTTSSGTAQTALEKLQSAIDKTFAKLDRRLGFQDSLSSLRDSLLENGSNFSRFSESGRKNIGAVRDMIDSLSEQSNGDSKKFSSSLNAMKKAMTDAGLGGTKAMTMINKAIKASGSNAKASAVQVRQFANALRMIESGNVISAANAIEGLADSVMTYLNARWMLGNAQMEIAAGWEEIANGANEAKEEIEDISDEIAGFAADRGILEYQLGIAIKYGDTLRANELRAQIAELNQREEDLIQQTNEAASQAQSQTTPQADLLAQQQALQNMVGYYVQIGAAEVIAAKNKKEAKDAIKGTVDAFKEQAREAGVSEENVAKYAKELRKGLRLARELNKPAEYKINARTQAALNQIRAFRDSANAAINAIRDNVTVRVNTVYALAGGGPVYASAGGKISGSGSGTSDSIPAMLSNGEFVMRASAVKAYGVDFMNSLNQMQVGRPMPVGTSTAPASSSSVVYLSPEDRSLLRAAIDRPVNLYTDNAKIAQSANQGNVLLAQRGLN